MKGSMKFIAGIVVALTVVSPAFATEDTGEHVEHLGAVRGMKINPDMPGHKGNIVLTDKQSVLVGPDVHVAPMVPAYLVTDEEGNQQLCTSNRNPLECSPAGPSGNNE